MNRNFVSNFGTHLDNMIDLKISMGFTESTYLDRARSFDLFCEQKHPDCTRLTEALALEWIQAVMGKGIHAVHNRLSFLRGFAIYLNRMGQQAFVFPARFTSGTTVFVPYIFSDNELTALFHAIDSCEYPWNEFYAILLSTYFRLTYTCGLRPKEGRVLKKSEVDLKTGEVRLEDSKNRKSRTIVMSDDMRTLANAYAVILNSVYPNSEYFFPSRKETPYTEASMQRKFKKFFALANPDVPEEFLPQVRVYDLRNTHINKIRIFLTESAIITYPS